MFATLKTIDLYKPRLRKKRIYNFKLINKDFFEIYRQIYPNSSIDTFEKMKKVLHAVNQRIIEKVSTTREGVEFAKLAKMVVVSYIPRTSILINTDHYINIVETKKSNKVVKFTNFHTEGRCCRLLYSMDLIKYKFVFRNLWQFNATRLFTRTMSKEFRKDYKKFVESDGNVSLRQAFNSNYNYKWHKKL